MAHGGNEEAVHVVMCCEQVSNKESTHPLKELTAFRL